MFTVRTSYMNEIIIKGVACPLERAASIIGDRWITLILRELFIKGSCRFQDFSDGIPSISPSLLSNRLKKLLDLSIVELKQYSAHPPRYDYHLSDKGMDTGKILMAMREWGEKYTLENET